MMFIVSGACAESAVQRIRHEDRMRERHVGIRDRVGYAIVHRRRGMDRFEALVDACHKRARPIVMTTLAMGAGMLPIALGWGSDPSFRSPMAIAVIGGLITSTLLSLLVVPAVFTFVDDVAQWVRRLFKGRA